MFKVGCVLLSLFGIFLAVFAAQGDYDTEHTWVVANKSIPFPRNAVVAGFSNQGYFFYVARCRWDFHATARNALPAHVKPEDPGRIWYNLDSGAREEIDADYQLLVKTDEFEFEWITSHDDKFERNMVSVGSNMRRERTFPCRANTNMGLLPGHFAFGIGCMVSSKDFPLTKFDKYELLVSRYVKPTSCA
ncbi:uncharacterized protein [Drosophila takahashii]|uniref:uncharacterized protein n=1 Tax=Drosophila takahashii TaxID=29030 RepID=UPI001CF917A2|nr:uncharacterized protein LOC108069484 [Drosophila takahashii]